MRYSIGDNFPNVTFNWLDENFELKKMDSDDIFENKKVVLIGMPGAFSPTCSVQHLPSFIESFKRFEDKGVSEIYCLVVNDVYVSKVWGEYTGATKAGIKIITDPLSICAEKLDLEFSVKGSGLLRRLKRFTMVINDKKIEQVYFEEKLGVCDLTSAKSVLQNLN
jgi:cytochrome c peroxidase